MPATWLVTGGAGFIGGNFVRKVLAERGVAIVNLDQLSYAACPATLEGLDEYRHRLVVGDINDAGLVRALLAEHQPRAVVHFAAESHVDRSIDGPRAFFETNAGGTLTLLETVSDYWRGLDGEDREAFRFLHISTDEVYGSLGGSGRFSEASQYRPNSPYAASKAAADHLVRAWHHTYGLPVLTTNCSNNYGPYQHPEKLIPLMICKAVAGEPLPVYGDGGQVRDWLYVGDHVDGLLRVLQGGRPGRVYNIGGDCERTNLEVVTGICACLDELRPAGAPHARLIRHVADRPGHDRRYAIDAGRIGAELDWRPATTFERGLRRTVAWYLEHGDWIEAARQRGYRGERLGVAR